MRSSETVSVSDEHEYSVLVNVGYDQEIKEESDGVEIGKGTDKQQEETKAEEREITRENFTDSVRNSARNRYRIVGLNEFGNLKVELIPENERTRFLIDDSRGIQPYLEFIESKEKTRVIKSSEYIKEAKEELKRTSLIIKDSSNSSADWALLKTKEIEKRRQISEPLDHGFDSFSDQEPSFSRVNVEQFDDYLKKTLKDASGRRSHRIKEPVQSPENNQTPEEARRRKIRFRIYLSVGVLSLVGIVFAARTLIVGLQEKRELESLK
jgi:hypothetical protein